MISKRLRWALAAIGGAGLLSSCAVLNVDAIPLPGNNNAGGYDINLASPGANMRRKSIDHIRRVMHHFRGEPNTRKSIAPSQKLWTALRELDSYLTGQSAWLVNYAQRHRAGLRVGTSITEGTANFLVNRRMNKRQQMRWSRRGADLLLQVRCAIYNGALGSEFGQKFHPANDTFLPTAIAA